MTGMQRFATCPCRLTGPGMPFLVQPWNFVGWADLFNYLRYSVLLDVVYLQEMDMFLIQDQKKKGKESRDKWNHA